MSRYFFDKYDMDFPATELTRLTFVEASDRGLASDMIHRIADLFRRSDDTRTIREKATSLIEDNRMTWQVGQTVFIVRWADLWADDVSPDDRWEILITVDSCAV